MFRYLDIFIALFIVTLIVSNIVSIKIVGFGPIVFDAGTILFPLAYILGDVITEVYGFKRMRRILVLGISTLLITSLTFWIVGAMPAIAEWGSQDAYDATLGVVWRIVAASISAIFIGELLNAYVLAKLKIHFKGRHLWGRIVGSSVVGNAADTLIFSTIAFAGTMSFGNFMSLVITVYLIKMAIEIIVSPITMLVIKRIKKAENLDSYEDPALVKI
jgi:uncharacterized integral membrane protein (TIGR00697 family)